MILQELLEKFKADGVKYPKVLERKIKEGYKKPLTRLLIEKALELKDYPLAVTICTLSKIERSKLAKKLSVKE